MFSSGLTLLHGEDLFFIFFPTNPALWELNNHGLFLQGCMVTANTHEIHHSQFQIKHDPLCPLLLCINAQKSVQRKPV